MGKYSLIRMGNVTFGRFSEEKFSELEILSKFQSEPVLETPLTREEQVQNLIERFDRFACSDSDED